MNRKEQISKLKATGMSLPQIAKQLGISVHTVKWYHYPARQLHHRKARNRRLFRIVSSIKKEMGGKCTRCGYDKCLEALQFHHLDPHQKRGTVSRMRTSLKKMREEISKCQLLCANCHAEITYCLP